MNSPSIRRILYIEDEPHIQAVAQVSLEDVGGFTVAMASSGKEGLVKAREFAPDLILLDAMMPGMDGVSTFLALRGNPQTKGIPVVFMTAKVQPQEVEGFKKLGALAVIPKPFDPMTLSDEIRAIWEKAHDDAAIQSARETGRPA